MTTIFHTDERVKMSVICRTGNIQFNFSGIWDYNAWFQKKIRQKICCCCHNQKIWMKLARFLQAYKNIFLKSYDEMLYWLLLNYQCIILLIFPIQGLFQKLGNMPTPNIDILTSGHINFSIDYDTNRGTCSSRIHYNTCVYII